MANVRVTCPTCNAELEIGEEHLGKEVECGSCLQAFVAEDPREKKQPYKMRRPKDKADYDDDDDRPSRRKRRRRDDDEDEYDYSPPGTSSGSGGGSGLAVTSLILGILSFPMFCCCYLNVPISLAGIVTGMIAMQKPQGKGMAVTGVILSVLSLMAFGGLFLFWGGVNAVNFAQPNRFR